MSRSSGLIGAFSPQISQITQMTFETAGSRVLRKMIMRIRKTSLFLFLLLLTVSVSTYSQSKPPEYLWYEAENMRGFTTGKLGEPVLNPSYLNLSRDKVPGWGMNGPGVSAEWTQGGESEWNSA